MSEYRKLKEEFEQNVKKLQENCEHEELTDWKHRMWAPGHYTNTEVKMCKRCGKTVKERTADKSIQEKMEEDMEEMEEFMEEHQG